MYDVILDYNSLLNDVMITNATYLGISVVIILGTGIVFYFVNIKPFQDKVEKIANDLAELSNKNSDLTRENESLKNDLKNSLLTTKRSLGKQIVSFENKLGELEDHISSSVDGIKTNTEKTVNDFILEMKERFKQLEEKTSKEIIGTKWDHEWSNTYLWDTRGVPVNTFISLVSAYKFARDTKDSWRMDLVTNSIKRWLQKHMESLKADELFVEYKAILLEEISTDTNPNVETQEIIKLLT